MELLHENIIWKYVLLPAAPAPTNNLSSGENCRHQQGSEGAHLIFSSSLFREHNQEVTNLGSISLSVCGDPNPQLTAPRLALVWLGLSSWLAEANPLWISKIKTMKVWFEGYIGFILGMMVLPINIVYPKNNVQTMKSHWRTKLQKPASEWMLFSLKSTVSLLTLALLSTLWYSFNRKDGNVGLSLKWDLSQSLPFPEQVSHYQFLYLSQADFKRKITGYQMNTKSDSFLWIPTSRHRQASAQERQGETSGTALPFALGWHRALVPATVSNILIPCSFMEIQAPNQVCKSHSTSLFVKTWHCHV